MNEEEMTITFKELKISAVLVDSLTQNAISSPTKIQQQAIPLILSGRDVIASSQTGTGKTFAFLLPIITKMLQDRNTQCLIIEPTRELAQQVLYNIKLLLSNSNIIKYVLLIGGEGYFYQEKYLKQNPRVIIGTPGRIIDHLQRQTLNLYNCHYLVLDETDRMFDMGFYEQLEKIFTFLPETKQTVMFSATFPQEIQSLAEKHLVNPEKIFVQTTKKANIVADNLTQDVLFLQHKEKYDELVRQLTVRQGNIIVFVNTQRDVEYLSNKLRNNKLSVGKIHGGLRQRQRQRTIKLFKDGIYRILLGTDVIARGIDIPTVMHVINYSLPENPEEYIHRIGRTARAGQTGEALSLVEEKDKILWQRIQELLHPELKKKTNNYDRKRKYKKFFHHKKQIK
ncbi:MAG: DEAD/DEAH box helicase [Cytophagales bacterium]|nr:DEAD/DEAH box helicase [Cytophagales bacterium]